MGRPLQNSLWQKVGRALADYQMIQDGDHIAVSVSGGKDSVALLYVLSEIRRYAPVRFDLEAITLDLGLRMDFAPLVRFTGRIGVPFHLVKTEIARIIFEIRHEKNPCSLCSKLRNGALHNRAKELGCNKVALGHHADDAVETLLMSMFFEGRIHTFQPKSFLDRKEITIIRPLVYVREKTLEEAVEVFDLPVVANHCPADKQTKRHEIKALLDRLEREIPDLRDNLLRSLQNVDYERLWVLKDEGIQDPAPPGPA